MNFWEKVKIISTAISVIFIPIIVGIIGSLYTRAISERELQGKFVELAVNILSESPTKENRNLREWATKIIDLHSGVQLSDSTKNDLIERIPIESNNISLFGRVINSDGNPVSNATLTFIDDSNMGLTVTDDNGEFYVKLSNNVFPGQLIKVSVKLKNKIVYTGYWVVSHGPQIIKLP
ncbi:carboxypeptidase regulatory-like domain-containing protein, partial [candidate division KSB1 bacterium]|nr:carboxypeptidase regulatory-like domain-containing protein [candidate division KSB1 bacterium]